MLLALDEQCSKWTLKRPELLMASYVEDRFVMLNDTMGVGRSVTVLNEDTVAPRHAAGAPSGLIETSVDVTIATG
jgi:hypothetical protein